MPLRHVSAPALLVFAAALAACRSDPPPAAVTLPSASVSAPPPATATASTAPLPNAASLELEAAIVPATSSRPGIDAIAIELTIVNPTSAPATFAWYRPLMYGIEVTDQASGAHVSVVIPPIDTPVSREEVTLAPGERKKVPNAVTLWFDPSGKAKTSMFDWVIVAKRSPMVFGIHLSVDLGGDAGQLTMQKKILG